MEIIKQTKYTLILDEAEAKWLKAIMQNPIFDESPDKEPKDEQRMRHKFFDTLKWAGVDNCNINHLKQEKLVSDNDDIPF